MDLARTRLPAKEEAMPAVKKKTQRRDPKPGVVVQVPLPRGRFGYLCSIDGTVCRLYNFISNRPIQDTSYFSKDRWKLRVAVFGFFMDVLDVCTISLTDEDQSPVPTWRESLPTDLALGRPPFRIYEPHRGAWYGTADDIKGISEDIRVRAETLSSWMAKMAPKLELIRVSSAIGITEKKLPVPEVDDDFRTISIEIPSGVPNIRDVLYDIETDLNSELARFDGGSVTGSGVMLGSGADIGVEANARRFRRVLKTVRKVLEKLEVPPETEIHEWTADGAVVIHHLGPVPRKGSAPKRGKKRNSGK